jgi:putative transcriptional regulator
MSERKISPINEAILEIVSDLRGGAVSGETADKITMRILGQSARAKPEPLAPDEIRGLRERAHMSQAVFARVLNVTPGYLAQIERGAKRATGAALAMLHVIRRKGIEAVL